MPELWGGSADLAESNNTTIEGAAVVHPDRARRPRSGRATRYGRVLHFGIREHAHGRDHERHRAARRHPRLRRHVPDLHRLHAPGRAARRADGAAGHLRLDARLDRRSARTARPTSRSSTSPRCAPSRASTSCARPTPTRPRPCWRTILEQHRPAGRPDPDPPERAGLPARRGRLRHRRRRRARAATSWSTPRAATPTSSSSAPAPRCSSPSQARDAAGREGHHGPRGLDAVPRVVRRAGRRPTARACSRRPSRPGSPSRPASPRAGARSSATPDGSSSLEHFGASADYRPLYREFGITAEAVADAAEDSIRVATG